MSATGDNQRIAAEAVLTPDGWRGPATVVVRDGRVAAVEPTRRAPAGRLVVPGFVDLQVNGIGDVDVATASGGGWDELDRRLAAQGVTTWCPTLLSAPLERYPPALTRLDEAARRPGRPRPAMAGVHLEGPFLGGLPGAHRADWVRPPDSDFLRHLPTNVRVVTLGPEQPGAIEAVAALAGRGVLVALGHTAAGPATVNRAAAAGARLVTHLYNAMPPFHHRTPGPVAAALLDDRLACSVIADGHHAHPLALALAWRAKGAGRMVLVTDSVAGEVEGLGGAPLALAGGVPRRADGRLAGSTVTMDAAVRFVVHEVGLALEMAVAAAAVNPARLLGLADRGAVAPGRRADLVALDRELAVEATWVTGRLIHPPAGR